MRAFSRYASRTFLFVLLAVAGHNVRADSIATTYEAISVETELADGYCVIDRQEQIGKFFYPRLDRVMFGQMASIALFMDCEDVRTLKSKGSIQNFLVGVIGFAKNTISGEVVYRPDVKPEVYYSRVAEVLRAQSFGKTVEDVNRRLDSTDLGTNLQELVVSVLDEYGDGLTYRLDEIIRTKDGTTHRVSIGARQMLNGHDMIFMINDDRMARDWSLIEKQVRTMAQSATWR